jgi:radical SAM superfamily enzyme YgiQ (UPF0313 family)
VRIALCDPPSKESYYHSNFPNLGILYLISRIRERYGKEFQVLYLDGHHSLDEHLKKLDKFQPELYGISFSFIIQNLAYKVIERVKRAFPGLPIVCGGPMPTADPQAVLESSPADICVRGEGEDAFSDLAEYFQEKRSALRNIEGIVFRGTDGRIQETAKRSPIRDIDQIPPPAWGLIDFSRYKGWHIQRSSPQGHLLVNRGCPYDCNYCSNPVWKYNKPWVRLRSPANIAREVETLYKYGVREIYLSGDEFNVNEKWTIDVCRTIEGLGFKDLFFNCNVRPDVITPSIAEAFKKINLWVVHLGIESGNQKTLDGVGKKIRLEQITDACRILKHEGIKVFGFVMLFHAWEESGQLKWESAEDVNQTINYCRKLFKEKLLDYMSWQVATPMKGSRLWTLATKHNLLPSHEIRSVFLRNLELPGVNDQDVNRALRKGLLLKNYYMLRNRNINFRHLKAVGANLKVMLGLGPPSGAY